MRTVGASAGQAVYHDFIVAPDTCAPAKRLHTVLVVDTELDQARLERAISDTVATHESLRTELNHTGGRALQIIREPSELTESAWQTVDWDGTPEATSRIICAYDDWWTQPRELAVRVLVGRGTPGRTLLVLLFNHACCDGIGADLVAESIRRAYDEPGTTPQPVLAEQFSSHYAAMLDDGEQAYPTWQHCLGTGRPAIPDGMVELKLAAGSAWVRVLERRFAPASAAALRQLTREHRCSAFEILATCAGVYFRREDGQPAAFGVIHSGRHRPRGLAVVGLLRSYLVDVADVSANPDVATAVQERCTALRRASAQLARLPFEEACRRAGVSPGWRAGEQGAWEVELNATYTDEGEPSTMGGAGVHHVPPDISDEAYCESGGPAFLLYFSISRTGVLATVRYLDPPVDERLAQRVAADFEDMVAFLAGGPERVTAQAPAFFAAARQHQLATG